MRAKAPQPLLLSHPSVTLKVCSMCAKAPQPLASPPAHLAADFLQEALPLVTHPPCRLPVVHPPALIDLILLQCTCQTASKTPMLFVTVTARQVSFRSRLPSFEGMEARAGSKTHCATSMARIRLLSDLAPLHSAHPPLNTSLGVIALSRPDAGRAIWTVQRTLPGGGGGPHMVAQVSPKYPLPYSPSPVHQLSPPRCALVPIPRCAHFRRAYISSSVVQRVCWDHGPTFSCAASQPRSGGGC